MLDGNYLSSALPLVDLQRRRLLQAVLAAPVLYLPGNIAMAGLLLVVQLHPVRFFFPV